MFKAMVEKQSIKSFDDVIKMQRKKNVFERYLGFQTSEGDKQSHFLVENFELF